VLERIAEKFNGKQSIHNSSLNRRTRTAKDSNNRTHIIILANRFARLSTIYISNTAVTALPVPGFHITGWGNANTAHQNLSCFSSSVFTRTEIGKLNLYTGFPCFADSAIFLSEDGVYYRWGKYDICSFSTQCNARGQLFTSTQLEHLLYPEPFECPFSKDEEGM
jgi:hypothetical protein